MPDASALTTFVDAWRDTTARTITLLEDLDDDAWLVPTDLPGWRVREVVAHLAHLEAVLAGSDPDQVGTEDTIPTYFTERGVAARADRSPAELVDELRTAVEARSRALDPPPADPSALPKRSFGDVGLDWQTLLRNRVVDTWVHEQDVRDALDRPGGRSAPGAQVTVRTFAGALPFVLGRKVRPEPGTSVRWVVTGDVPLESTAVVDQDGRARPSKVGEPTTSLTLSCQDFVRLLGGRRGPERLEVGVDGDRELADRVLASAVIMF